MLPAWLPTLAATKICQTTKRSKDKSGFTYEREKCLLPPLQNANMSCGAIFIEIIRKKAHMGGAGAVKKTSPEFTAVGDEGNRQNLAGAIRPDH